MITQRKAVNEIIPGKIYQRGQILTWKYLDKVALLEELNIGLVVNFWPKIDADLTDVWYFHLPTARSKDMLSEDILFMAQVVSEMLKHTDKAALILCEAGKTRSVYFSTLLMVEYLGITERQALAKISKIVPQHKLKIFMLDKMKGTV